jgi:transposase-like protein
VIAEIDRLLDHHTEGEVAAILNDRGCRSGQGGLFARRVIARLRRDYALKTRFDRLRAAGMLTAVELARELDIHPSTLHDWRRAGLVQGYPYNDKNEFLYEPSLDRKPHKLQGIKRSDPRRFSQVASDRTKEVQDAT